MAQHHKSIPADIRRAIYMSKAVRYGKYNNGYRLVHHMPGEEIVCEVPTYEMGLCLVQCLRDRAKHRRDEGRVALKKR